MKKAVQSRAKSCATLCNRKNEDAPKLTFSACKNSVRASGWLTYPDGIRERVQATGKTEQLATEKWKAKAEEKRYEHEYGVKVAHGDITMGQAIASLITEYETVARDGKRGEILLRDSTVKRMRCAYRNQIKPTFLDSMMVHDVTAGDISRWKAEISRQVSRTTGKPISTSTKCRAYTLVADIMGRYRIESNPCDIVKKWHQRSEKRTIPNVLDSTEIKSVLSACNDLRQHPKYAMDMTYCDLTELLIFTYLRPGEGYGLEKRDWHPEEGRLDIHRTGLHEDGRLKTKASYREIYVPQQVAEILDRRCCGLDPHEKLFKAAHASMIDDSSYADFLKRILKQCGIRKDSFSPHKLRGTGISLALSLGVPVEIVSRNAGHSSISTTMSWYVQVYDDSRKRATAVYAAV